MDDGQLAQRVEAEIDDVLGTIPMVRGDAALAERLFAQLVDLLVEGLFLDCQRRYRSGRIDRARYVAEVGELAGQCHRAGLLPLPPG